MVVVRLAVGGDERQRALKRIDRSDAVARGKMRKPEQVRQSVMAKLKKRGKGIVLLHDFQHATGEAAMDLLNDLKAGGYKVVFMKPKFPVTTIASYDEQIAAKGPTGGGADGRPTSSVVRTIAE